MTYEQIEEEISSIPKFSPKASLPNLSAYLEKCNHPERKLRVIHVAGTNGKGSVCAFLESILRKAGYRTALFTSPHLVCIGERFRINFEMCTEEQLTGAWKTVRELMLTGESEGRKPLTYFEVLFLMSVLIFSEEKVDYCIMETGLGGRLDATVLCDPVLSVITSISLDHTEILGDTIEKIAAEKAGIIKTGVPVVAFDEENGAFPVLETEAKKKKTHIYKVRYENITILKKTENNIDFSINSSYYKCNLLSVSGIANYQIYNGALAATAAKILLPELCDEVIREGLYHMQWEGRMEELFPGVYVDGAHNPGAVYRICQTIGAEAKKWSLLFAVCADKDYTSMIELLTGLPWKKIYVTALEEERGASAASVATYFAARTDSPVQEISCAAKALETARKQKGEEECLLCLGSLYLAGELKRQRK